MGKFWCLLFGHKWHTIADWMFANTDTDYMYFCKRCASTSGNLVRGKKL